MKKTQEIVIGAIIVAIAFLAMTAVTASPRTQNTPLYTYRMEQTSSKMNFLPTALNTFTYITEKGYNLNYEIPRQYCGSAEPLGCTSPATTCQNTCPESQCVGTCESCGGYTCDDTSCQYTCDIIECVSFTTCRPPPCPLPYGDP